MSDQLRFDWAETATEEKPSILKASKGMRVPHSLPSPTLYDHRKAGSLRKAVEQYLRDRSIPMVDVFTAKKSLFGRSSMKLGTFHLVAYSKSGKNWLIWAAGVKPDTRKDMAEWQTIFGEDFVAVIARKRKAGQLAFHTLDKEPIAVE